MKKRLAGFLALVAWMLVAGCGSNPSYDNTSENDRESVVQEEKKIEKPLTEVYNLPDGDYNVVRERMKKNQVLSDILYPNHIDYPRIQEVVDQSKDIYSTRRLRAGQTYTLFLNKDSLQTLAYMVYDIDRVDYLVYDFTDSVRVYRAQKPVRIVEKTASGIIHSSLWQTMIDNNLNQDLILDLADVFAWTIDFYHLQKNDSFRVIYTEKMVDGQSVGIDRIIAAEFTHAGTPIRAYLYESEGIEDYFDDEGKSLRKAFLRAPVKFSRISSRYSKRRFHPVQKRYKAHLGTDYAAPKGTPILATGDGVVIASAYGKYNGNYVKIRHNATYTTQYLHMSKRAVKLGDRVKQGDVIGYVGSTGLATGPHVCYRFWKNGKQVNPYRQKLPASKPVKAENMEAFMALRNKLAKRLDSIPVENRSSAALAHLN